MKLATWTPFFKPPPCAPHSYFISFEGIEGSGKSSLMQKFRDDLSSQGYNVHSTREPGGTAFGEKLRQAILDQPTPLHPLAEAHLFASARAQLLSEFILPTLAKPKQVVLCDRFLDSSLAYQGIGRQLGLETIFEIHRQAPLTTTPHLTFYLQIDTATSAERLRKRGQDKDYFETQKQSFFTQIIAAYDQLAQLFPQRIHILDAKAPFEQVYQQLLTYWQSFQAGQV